MEYRDLNAARTYMQQNTQIPIVAAITTATAAIAAAAVINTLIRT